MWYTIQYDPIQSIHASISYTAYPLHAAQKARAGHALCFWDCLWIQCHPGQDKAVIGAESVNVI